MRLKLAKAVEAMCPCGQEITVGDLAEEHEGMSAGTPVCLHAEPRCQKFVELELVEYLVWVNDETARARGLPPIDRSKLKGELPN